MTAKEKTIELLQIISNMSDEELVPYGIDIRIEAERALHSEKWLNIYTQCLIKYDIDSVEKMKPLIRYISRSS